jgi:hypothetical protein
LPLRRWMAGPLKSTCESALKSLKDTGFVQPQGVDLIWKSFLEHSEDQGIWSRALTLVALGHYCKNN